MLRLVRYWRWTVCLLREAARAPFAAPLEYRADGDFSEVGVRKYTASVLNVSKRQRGILRQGREDRTHCSSITD